MQSVIPVSGGIAGGGDGMAVDASGDLFIAEGLNDTVVEVEANGTQTTVGSGLLLFFPEGVAVDGSGDVFIADTGNNRVVELKANGTQTTVGSGLMNPGGVAVDGSGDVFIAESQNTAVVEVEADGTQTTVGSGLKFPAGVAVDSAGDVFIADSGNNRVVEVKADGTQTTVGPGSFSAQGVAVDGSGDVFVAGSNNGVVELKVDGTQTTFGSGIGTASGVAVDGSGDVYIADTSNHQVVELTAGVPIQVAPATLTVTANDASRAYESANPAFTDTITGFVNGQNASFISGSPVLSTTATLASRPGQYAIAVGLGTLTATNYTFTLVNGSLTVAAPPLVTLSQVKDVLNKKHLLTEILVTFSGPVNATEADEIAFYDLATQGRRGSFTAKNAGKIKLLSAVYDAATDTVKLAPKRPFSLSKPVQLTINGTGPGGLQDSVGRLIDGADSGEPGTSAVAVLRRKGVVFS